MQEYLMELEGWLEGRRIQEIDLISWVSWKMRLQLFQKGILKMWGLILSIVLLIMESCLNEVSKTSHLYDYTIASYTPQY